MNRRQFFSLNFGATIEFLGNFLAPQLDMERTFFRPPGADDELQFLTLCNRCGLCKSSCPEGIIELFTIKDGAKIVNTPYIDPNKSPCTFCQKCIDVCPNDALNHENILKIGTAKIIPQNCLTYKDVMCDYCKYACPVDGAIQLFQGKPVVDESLCTGCGQCVAACISVDKKGIYISPTRTIPSKTN